MKYILDKGSNKHLIITLHGTGGTATDLFNVASFIDPSATMVGFQGTVLEHGMARFFARYEDGTFDIESLTQATHDLYESILRLVEMENMEDYMITVLGYSNGANIAKNLLKTFENVLIDTMILFHPSPISPDVNYKHQDALDVFITSGLHDPFISDKQFKQIEKSLSDANIRVKSYTHENGHQLIHDELIEARNFIQKEFSDSKNSL